MSKRKDGKKEVDGEKVVLEYMQKQNRPYNAKIVSENLHGDVKLAEVTRILEELSQKGDLIEKVNGKQKIYWYNQSKLTDITPEVIRELENKRQELKVTLSTTKEELMVEEKTNKILSSQLSNEELEKQLKQLSEEVSKLEEKYKKFKDQKITIDPKEKAKLLKDNEFFVKEWKKRKRICKDASELLTESSGMKISKLYETLGIETDEQNGFTLDKLIDYQPKRSLEPSRGKSKK
ncbi:hypothetical protein ENUP19_0038G0009 [Entamoeba nuttalli]|uniref:Homologous-pairing protein 2 homolog n=2 Tax=Entamoeba nuttalli TaxID=412467 RepID=K2H8B1_ENTNP|nr:TBP interacting protein, putative [Entamoeba nuttalli P19]EKE38754.1 TBP interacting protein, putative [Entamoeba nuttalli P19]|eukprot:XP_008858912.1 TBP interacting protein, putative [Entamoeba nuttalli P19]